MYRESLEQAQQKQFFDRRLIAAAVSVSSILSSCGGDTFSHQATTVTDTVSFTVAQVSEAITPVTTVNILPTITTNVVATTINESVEPLIVKDCSHANILVFGNSIPAVTDSNPNPWPLKLEYALNLKPDINEAHVTNVARPASNIISPSPYDSGPMSRLVTAIPYILKKYTPEQKADTTVILDPSFGETISIDPNDTDETAVARAVKGIETSIYIAHKNGVEHVIVLPIGSVASVAEELQKRPLNLRISLVNKVLQTLGITPKTMPVSPLTDPSTGKGNWKFFKNFVSKGPIMKGAADGVHPDNNGNEVYAQAMANLPELQSALLATCKAKK